MIEQAHAPGKASHTTAAPVLREQGVRMSSFPPRHPGQLARQEGETDRKTGKRDGILRRWNYDDLSPGSPPPTPGQPRTRPDPSEESGPSPYSACVGPSVSAPVPCRPHGLHLLPHTSASVASMPSTSWNPSPCPSIPVQLWEEVPKTLRISRLSWAASGPLSLSSLVSVGSVLCPASCPSLCPPH